LRRLILLACQLASRAAHRLDTAPAAAGGVFKDFFADHPSRPVPAAGNQTAGRIVASRLRQVEKDLRLRGTRYKCDTCDAGSRSEAASMGGIIDAYAIAFPTKNEVWLCPDFWALPDRFQQAGILLHELCHLSFHPLFKHVAAETKGTSAYCYEGFVLQVQGHAPDAVVRTKCRSTRVN
jgi:predicted SprT family Zn-dependent metalloprotease